MIDKVRECSSVTSIKTTIKFSALSFQNQYIIVTGCWNKKQQLKAVHRYSTREDRWDSELPETNEDRDDHSSCIVRSKLFVFGGFKKQYDRRYPEEDRVTASIEFLNLLNISQGWQLVRFQHFSARYACMATPLNLNTIFIGGGVSAERRLNDILLFNVDTMTFKQMSNNNTVVMDSHYSQSIMVRPGRVVALLRNRKHQQCIMTYDETRGLQSKLFDDQNQQKFPFRYTPST